MDLTGIKRVYFIGIGGSSMSSLAEILIGRGYTVAGSDMQESATVDHLRSFGADVTVGQKAENVERFAPDAVIKTDAIMDTNPELIYSKEHNIPVYRRAELLGYIIDGYEDAIGVAGTHGKTTTTSMITSIFLSSERDASSIIGGHMKRIDSSYLVGKTKEMCIFESCEFKSSFLHFRPRISVILNIKEDHMEYFKTLENLINTFKKYLLNTREGGTVVANAEDENSRVMLEGYSGNVVYFGLEKGDFTAKNITLTHGLPI